MPNFDAIRLFATVAIVMLHTAANGVNRLPFDSSDWWLANFVDSASRAGVPLFLMLTGALLLNRSHQSARQFYRNRLQKLAWPLALWSLFYLGWSALKAEIKQQPYGVSNAVSQLLSGAPYFHLWFIYMLLGLYLVLPLLRNFWLQLTPARQSLFCLCAILLQQSLHGLYFLLALPEPPWPLWWIGYLPYLLLGAWLTRPSRQAAPGVSPLLLLSGMALLTCITALLYHWQRDIGLSEPFYYSYHRMSLPVLLSALLLWQLLQQLPPVRHPLLQAIRRHSLGIYCAHPMLLDLTEFGRQQLAQVAVPITLPYAVQLLLQISLVLGASLLFSVLLQRLGDKLFQHRTTR